MSLKSPLLLIFALATCFNCISWAQSDTAQERYYSFGTVLNKEPVAVLIGASVLPTSRLRLEVFPISWVSLTASYVSSRIMGLYPSDFYEKINAGITFHPFLYTIKKTRGDKTRWLTINAFWGPQVVYWAKNSFRTFDKGGFLQEDYIFTHSTVQGYVINSGARVLYGGRSFGVELSLSLVVGYAYFKVYDVILANTFAKQVFEKEYNKIIGFGDYFVSLIYVIGKPSTVEKQFNEF